MNMDEIIAYLKGKYNPGDTGTDLQNKIMPSSPSFDVGVSDTTVPMAGKIEGSDVPGSMPPVPPLPDASANFDFTKGLGIPSPAPANEPVAPIEQPKVAPVTPSTSKDEPALPSPLSTANDDAARLANQKKLDRQKTMGAVGGAVAGIGDAIGSGLKAFKMDVPTDVQGKILDRVKTAGEEGSKDFETKISNDPNSDVSKAYRQMVLQIAPEMAKQSSFNNMSAKMIGDKLPLVDTMMKAQAQKDAKELGIKQLQANKQNANELKLADATTKRFKQLGDDLDPSRFRAGNFAVAEQIFNRAERLQSLASAFPDGNLDSRQIEELAIGLNSMLSGSNTGAQSQVKALVPHSARGNVQKTAEWLMNEPKGTNQQAFVNRMLGTIDREKSTAEDQMDRVRFSRIAKYGDLEHENPDTFNDILRSNKVDPEKYSSWKKNGYKPQSAVQGSEGTHTPGQRKSPGGHTYSVSN